MATSLIKSEVDVSFLVNAVSEILINTGTPPEDDTVRLGSYQASKKLFLEELSARKCLFEGKEDFFYDARIYLLAEKLGVCPIW